MCFLMVGRGTMMTLSLNFGRVASRISARGLAMARVDWYLRSWIRVPRVSARSPMM